MPSPSSSSTPSAPAPLQQNPVAEDKSSERSYGDEVLHNVALGVTPLAMGAMFLPPRKFDLRLIILGGVALWGTNRLVYDYSGRSTFTRFEHRLKSLTGSELPEKAQRTQMLLRQEKERRAAAAAAAVAGGISPADKERIAAAAEPKKGDRGALESIWMGDAGDDWKQQRDQREKEALQEGGGGYWSLIMDHISDVRSSGAQKRAEVVAAREEKQNKDEERKS